MAKIQLHEMVTLLEDVQTQRFPQGESILLRQGQVGTVVEVLGEGEAFEVEFADLEGQTYAMLAVVVDKLMVLRYQPIEPVPVSS
jgi:CRP-like cAMP-binding protein